MKTRLVLVLLTALGATGVSLAAASGPPIAGGLVATGTITYKSATVELSQAKGFVMEWAKVQPGASFGWHFHREPVLVAITAGTLTLYDSKDAACKPHRYSAGQGFIEPSNHIHIARNEGTKTVSLYATYIGVPAQWRTNPTPLDASVKNPGNCPTQIR
jgi:quercetin dioxygenase-like cupin family protein